LRSRHSRLGVKLIIIAIIPQLGYNCGMKVKTSITLSDDLIKVIDQYGQAYKNRSDFIEAAIRAFIKQIVRDQQNARDVEIINQNADRLNAEAGDVLEYQVRL
jgi:Arc/MetJ-type ribon-helix-helix transcriptional regulator